VQPLDDMTLKSVLSIPILSNNRFSHKLKIFRQLDRDGFTVPQINFLEIRKAENSDYKKFEQYKVKFLPVNEIENFAILTDAYYTEEKLQEFQTYSKISDAFNLTVKTNIINATKLCKNDDERKMFLNKDAEMIREARISLLKYFPGKDIKKIKKNFNCDNVLKKKNYSDLPPEFQNYLMEIKNYFEPTT
jgi:hypothetical protein